MVISAAKGLTMDDTYQRSIGVFELLRKLDDLGVPYVSWKNNHELEKALTGESDIDLFVPFDSRAKFFMLCAQEGWVVVENPVAQFPWVNHLYKPDGNLKFHHMHVYFKVVTGESWLKEYVLPLDEWLISNRVRSIETGVWILNNEAQAYLFSIRHLLKCGSLFSRLLYSRELDGYREEWLLCRQDPKLISDDKPISIFSFLAGANLYKNDLRLPRLGAVMKFRALVSPFLRVRWWALPALRIKSFLQRAVNKLFYGKKKILPDGGIVIAVSGVDGAGKSTMLAESNCFLSSFLTVDRYHLGRPQGPVIEMFRKLFAKNNITVTRERNTELKLTSYDSAVSIHKAISATVLALLRLRLARKISRRADLGHIVLVDRWPTEMVGRMDGPRIYFHEESGFVVQSCRRIEQWAYARMPRADICFYFELPLSVAIERNQGRIKKEKETDEEITARFEANRDFRPLARKTVRFDNAGDFEIKRGEFLRMLWAEIIEH